MKSFSMLAILLVICISFTGCGGGKKTESKTRKTKTREKKSSTGKTTNKKSDGIELPVDPTTIKPIPF